VALALALPADEDKIVFGLRTAGSPDCGFEIPLYSSSPGDEHSGGAWYGSDSDGSDNNDDTGKSAGGGGGKDCATSAPDYVPLVRGYLAAVHERINHPLVAAGLMRPSRANRAAMTAWDAAVGGVAARARAAPPPDYTIAARLLAMTDPGTGRPLDEERLAGELSIMYIAGFETTSHAIAWTLGLLACNPETQDRLAAELAAVLRAARVDRAVLVGVHFGWLAAAKAALRNPQRVAGLVLVDPWLPCAPLALRGVGERAVVALSGGIAALRSEDRGEHWREFPLGTERAGVGLWALSPTELVAVGARGNIARSADEGRTWQAVASPVPSALFAVWGASRGELWAVGSRGVILRSTDGGARWAVHPSGTVADLTTVWGAARDDVYAAGKDGTVLRWDGVRWSRLAVPTDRAIFGVWGSGADDVYLVGSGGLVLHGTGRGARWSQEPSGTDEDLLAVWGSGADDVYAVGYAGTILHRW
jgi:pimeloyl-ACP methyl ester carboxylesterase